MKRLKNLFTYYTILEGQLHQIDYLKEKFNLLVIKEENMNFSYKLTNDEKDYVLAYEKMWNIELDNNEKLIFLYSRNILGRNLLPIINYYTKYFKDYSLIRNKLPDYGIHTLIRRHVDELMVKIKYENRFNRVILEIRKAKLKKLK
jgi:hypothetical protein